MAVLVAACPSRAASNATAVMDEAEETYEIRLQRILQTKGHRALWNHLTQEMKERPRPYVKAWYANYLLYGVEFGIKEVSDPVRGFALAKESSDEGSLIGLELVGRAHGDGRGTERSATLAVQHLAAAVERDRDSAMGELGKFYFFGAGVTKDFAKAEELTRACLRRGAYGPMLNLAEWWEDARYVTEPNRAKANALYHEAAEMGSTRARKILEERAAKGERDAQKYLHIGFLNDALKGSNPITTKLRATVKWLEENCPPDDVQVQLVLADVLKERTMVVYDANAARAKLTRAAEGGSDEARAMLAMMAWRGIGQNSDEAGAVAIWRELAAKGEARSLNQMGWLHWWGNGERYGVPKDAQKAFEFCRRAGYLGYWPAQVNAAECYAHGIGVTVNYYRAVKYYDILAAQRFGRAREMRQRILDHVKD